MLRMSRIFNFLKKEDQIFGKIRENFGNVPIIQKIIQNYSVVSLGAARPRERRRGAGGRAPRARPPHRGPRAGPEGPSFKRANIPTSFDQIALKDAEV